MVTLYLRQENNDFLLQENTDKLVIETNTLFAVDASASTSMVFSVSGQVLEDSWTSDPELVNDIPGTRLVLVNTSGLIYTGTIFREHFVLFPDVEPRFFFVSTNDVVDIPYSLSAYNVTQGGNTIRFNGVGVDFRISVNGNFTLRTPQGQAPVTISYVSDPVFRAIITIGGQELDSESFDPVTAINDRSASSLVKAWESESFAVDSWTTKTQGTNTWL